MEKNKITCVLVARNEEKMIPDALESVSWCDQIIHIDNGSRDRTPQIVKQFGGKTIKTHKLGFDERKNESLNYITTPWVLFLDADERVTPLLRQEILTQINSPHPKSAYTVARRNIYLGKQMNYGGWGNDHVFRVFQKDKLVEWKGHLHEQPIISGASGELTHDLVHISHRDLESMLEKTIVFTAFESNLRIQGNHPPISWWRFFRVMFTEFWLRFVKLEAWKDGTEGIIDGIFQIFNTFTIYALVYEKQLNLPQRKI